MLRSSGWGVVQLTCHATAVEDSPYKNILCIVSSHLVLKCGGGEDVELQLCGPDQVEPHLEVPRVAHTGIQLPTPITRLHQIIQVALG
jgi:hypothetical protein